MSLPRPFIRASRLLEIVNAAGRSLYTSGIRSTCNVQVPVVSVGNIACGGTGKTPTVAALARQLRALGRRPAILTRGYGRRGSAPAVITGSQMADWRDVGDEPALLAATLVDVPVIVDADRFRGAQTAVTATGATHLILDDGFQHWRLARDLDVVVVDSADPLSLRSPRREGPHALARADVIVIGNAGGQLEEAAVAQARRFAPATPIVATRTVVRAVRLGTESLPPGALRGFRLFAAAGIASPHRFLATLAALGADTVKHRFFPDHHPFTTEELERMFEEARHEGLSVVMTGKDAVKVPANLAARVYVVEIDVECVHGSFIDVLRPVLGTTGLESLS